MIGLPPALLLAFFGELHHPVAFGPNGHAVKVTQVTNIAKGPGAETRLHASDLVLDENFPRALHRGEMPKGGKCCDSFPSHETRPHEAKGRPAKDS